MVESAVLRAGVCSAFVVLLSVAPLCAQATGTVQGRVLDASGAVVAGAAVVLTGLSSGDEWATTSDAEGHYQVAAIRVGSYRMEARAPGFRTERVPEWAVDVGRTLVRDFRLDVGDIAETLVVDGGVPSIDQRSRLGGRMRLDLRLDAFNVLNRPNFGQPGRVVGSPGFGRITNTRFPTGDAGSSRQLQLAAKLGF